MLKRGLEHAKIWTVRHGDEHLPGGALDYKALSSKLARIMWHELESHPIDNLAAERTLALDCYLTKVLGTRMRVLAREAMVKWSMNVRRSGGGLEIDCWSEEQRHRTLRDAMREGRRRIETQHQESARLHKERLPALRASEQQFRVAEAKKVAVLDAFKRMRAEGKEVRHVGAVGLLTAKQVQVQLALRHFLDGLAVKRSGKDDVLRPLLKEQLAAEAAAAGGEGQLTAEAEIARLKALGFGRKVRAAAPQQPRQADGHNRKRHAPAEGESDGSDSGDSSDSDGGDSDDDDEINIEELLEKDEDVYEVEKLLDVRQAAGGREFRVKWKGYSAKEATWEVEENILEKGMIKALLARKGKAAPKGTAAAAAASDEQPTAAAPPPPPRPEPTRAQPSRTAAATATKRAVAQQDEMSQSDEEEESEEEEARRAPRAVPTGGGKKQKAAPGATKRAPSKGKGTAKKQKTPQAAALQPDSSDEEEGA